jgi:hypothetical protein
MGHLGSRLLTAGSNASLGDAAVAARHVHIVPTNYAERMTVGRALPLLALCVLTAGLLAAITTALDRLGAYTNAGTVGYYTLPLVAIAAGVGGLVARAPATRAAWLVAGAAAVVGWILIWLTQTEVNGLTPPFGVTPDYAAHERQLPARYVDRR